MHEAMFEGDVEQLFRDFGEQLIDLIAGAGVVALDLGEGGPVRRLVIGELAGRGIDAEGEEGVELRMKAGAIEGVAADQVPIEGFEVAEVEDQAVAFGDGAFV